MTNRATVLAPRIIIASMMASAALVTGQLHTAWAADDCIAKPKESPAGKHWFYRIDRATKRQCWYLRDTTTQGASLEVRKSAGASHKSHAAFSPSAENAHAELASASTAKDSASTGKDDDAKSAPTAAAPPIVAAPPAVAAFPNVAAPAANSAVAVAETGAAAQQPSDSTDGTADQSAIAARWPDQMDQAAPVVATPRAPAFTVASAAPTADSDAAPIAPATTAGPSVGQTETSAISSGFGADVPDRTKLLVFLGAVALVGFSFSVLLGRARSRRRVRLEPAVARRATRWPAEPQIDRMRLPSVDNYYPAPIPVSDGSGGARRSSIVPRDEDGRDEEFDVEQMLARYAGQARTHR
jgi:hypothetical protein